MKIEAMKSFFDNEEKWSNLEYICTASGTTIAASSILGFKRKRVYLDPSDPRFASQHVATWIRPENWYFTYDENDAPSLGTLEIDEELGLIRYTERMEGKIIEHDIDNIITIVYKPTDAPNYPGVGGQLK